MPAVFGEPLPPLAWGSLDAIGRARAALLWEFGGRAKPIDELLATLSHRDVRVGARALAWWEVGGDAGLLFEGDRVVGHAIQFGFVCADRALWEELATAPTAPSMFSWEVEEDLEDGYVPDVFAPPDVAALVRDAEASRGRARG